MCQIYFVDITITMRYPLRIKVIPYRMSEQNSTKSPAMDVLQQNDEPLLRLGTESSRIVYVIFFPRKYSLQSPEIKKISPENCFFLAR